MQSQDLIQTLSPGQRLTVDPNQPLIASLVIRLRQRDELSQGEENILQDAIGKPACHDERIQILQPGDRPTSSTLIVEGFVGRYKILRGGERQITALHGPGDFVDLHGYLLKKMDHGIVALTRIRVAKISHASLIAISESHPHLSRLLLLLTAIDGSIHREWLVAMGRRAAIGHTAHLLCEIYEQLRIVNLAPNFQFLFPVTQQHLADMLGLSSVHVNRVIQELRGKKLITWEGPLVSILNWEKLVELAEFDVDYLYTEREPR